jgi:hypothetical protein
MILLGAAAFLGLMALLLCGVAAVHQVRLARLDGPKPTPATDPRTRVMWEAGM